MPLVQFANALRRSRFASLQTSQEVLRSVIAHHRQRRRVSFALTLASRQSICRQLHKATGRTGSKAAISSVLDQQRVDMSYELR